MAGQSTGLLAGPGRTAASGEVLPRVLLVDDDRALLDGLARHLRRRFDTVLVDDPVEALARLEADRSFAVIVSDMRMPGMDGATLLARASTTAPDTVRVLLTGFADVDAAAAAVNRANIFRFLTKPCPAGELALALTAAVEQHRLITAEKELLERTLRGSVQALVDTLELANPAAFTRAGQIRRLVAALYARLGLETDWQVDIAAQVAELGAITLPADVEYKRQYGLPLDDDEQAMVDRLPGFAADVLVPIPRLEGVVRLIGALAAPAVGGDELAVRVLRAAREFHDFEARLGPRDALEALWRRADRYGRPVLEALTALQTDGPPGKVREVPVGTLEQGMVLAAELRSTGGVLLLGKGHELTENSLARIANYRSTGALVGTAQVVCTEP